MSLAKKAKSLLTYLLWRLIAKEQARRAADAQTIANLQAQLELIQSFDTLDADAVAALDAETAVFAGDTPATSSADQPTA